MFLNSEYYEGKVAHREGWGRDESPYGLYTPESEDWLDGWDDADGESQI